jgi:hypothetical protein
MLFSYKVTPEFVLGIFVIVELVIIFSTEFVDLFMFILVQM